MEEKQILLKVSHLKKYFHVKKSINKDKNEYLHAVDDVSFTLNKGETLGLVGESGCGKSTLGRSVLRLHEITEGTIEFEGNDISWRKESELRPLRKRMQIIFQDPYASLNPKMTIRAAIEDPLIVYHEMNSVQRRQRVEEVMDYVGIPRYMADRYPHELSGGQRQRAAIARGIVLNPSFVVGDEPVSALDVSIRAQILNLMKDIQNKTGLSYLFISHDLSVVRYLCDKIAVMYLGKIVEIGTKKEIFENAKHPYTQALLSAIPIHDVHIQRKEIILSGDMPSPIHPPKGCRFCTRCPYATEECSSEVPELQGNAEHQVACFKFK